MDVYCKRCKKVLGTIADEKIPPNVKRYAACRTCNEKILLFRKVETSPPLEGDEERKKRQAAAATSSTAAYPQKDAAPSAPRKVSGQTHRTVTIQPLPPSTGLSRNGSGKASIPFPPQIDDQGIKKADLWTVTAMGAAVILLIVFARPQFDPSRFFPVGTAYEVPTATENLPVSREPKETITVARIVELRQMLLAQQFEQLNAVLEEYQKNFEADQTDEYSVYDAYRVFFNTDSSFEKPLKAWKNHSPDKYQPYLAIAQYYYAMGWESRGNEWSRDTSEEQFEGMESYFSKAEENLKVALEINPKVMPAYRLLIGIYNATANGTAEDIMINKGLELFPHSFLIRSISSWANEPRWGGSYAMMAEIAKDAERYAEINPKLTSLYGLIYYDQGRILYRQEKYDEAVARFTKALSFGDNGDLYEMRSRIYHFQQNEYDLAFEDINRAIELRPTKDNYYRMRARIYFATGDYDDALEDLNTAELIKPDDPKTMEWKEWAAKKLVYNGYQVYKESDYNGSLDIFDLAVAFNDENYEAYYWRGMAFTRMADLDSAFTDFDKAINLNPRHFDSYRMVDYILARDKNWESIIAYWDIFLELEPDNARAYLERAGTYYRSKDFNNALLDLERSCELGNEEACSRYQGLKSKT